MCTQYATLAQHSTNIRVTLRVSRPSKHESLIQCWVTVFDAGPTVNTNSPRLYHCYCWPTVFDAGPTVTQHCMGKQARIQRGGRRRHTPTPFLNSLKSPLNLPNSLGSEPPKPLRPLLFQILDQPLVNVLCSLWDSYYTVNTRP